jgi:hypothetical protein
MHAYCFANRHFLELEQDTSHPPASIRIKFFETAENEYIARLIQLVSMENVIFKLDF